MSLFCSFLSTLISCSSAFAALFSLSSSFISASIALASTSPINMLLSRDFLSAAVGGHDRLEEVSSIESLLSTSSFDLHMDELSSDEAGVTGRQELLYSSEISVYPQVFPPTKTGTLSKENILDDMLRITLETSTYKK